MPQPYVGCPNGQILLYERIGKDLTPAGIYDPRTSALTSEVTQTTRDRCLDAEREADTPILVDKPASNGKIRWKVWHDYAAYSRAATPDSDFIAATPPNVRSVLPDCPITSPDKMVGVYVCRMDGSQMRLLGTVPSVPPRLKHGPLCSPA